MAIKIVGIICAVSWALFASGVIHSSLHGMGSSPIETSGYVAFYFAIISTPILIIMALINYARRPR